MNRALTALLVPLLLALGCRRDPVPSDRELARHRREAKVQTDAAHKWFTRTLVGGYEQHGRHGPWDDSAKAALQLLADARTPGHSRPPEWEETVSTLAFNAINAGCDDPLIRYVRYRYGVKGPRRGGPEVAEALLTAARELQSGGYPANVKFYAGLRAAEALKLNATNTPPEVHEMRRACRDLVLDQLADATTPPEELQAMISGLLAAVRRNSQQYPEFWQSIEPVMFERWGKHAFPHLLKGEHAIAEAWAARGNGYADSVSPAAWKGFGEHLAVAEKELRKAHSLDPGSGLAATEMVGLAAGTGMARAEMERWFVAAMVADPANYAACTKKLNYLQPKWHGSPEDTLAFGRLCVTNVAWQGTVPLILADAHEALAGYLKGDERRDYWRDPAVWEDIRQSFAAFFAKNPEALAWKHNQAALAYRCERWNDYLRLVAEFPSTNLAYFGGQKRFEQMLATARANAGQP